MAYEHKEGQGALFSNTKTKETQPDVRGNIMIDGKLVKLAGWLKKRTDGSDWISLIVDDKPASDAPASTFGGLRNDVP